MSSLPGALVASIMPAATYYGISRDDLEEMVEMVEVYREKVSWPAGANFLDAKDWIARQSRSR